MRMPANSAVNSRSHVVLVARSARFIAAVVACAMTLFKHRKTASVFVNVGNGLDIVLLALVVRMRFSPVVIVHTSRGWAHYRNRVLSSLFAWASRRCLVFALTKRQAGFLRECSVSVSGIAPTLLSKASLDVARSCRHESRRLVFAGRMVEEKGIRDFAHVVVRFRCMHTESLEFLAAGDARDARLEDLEALRDAEVRVLGPLDETDLARLFATASVLVYPSRSDTYPLVVLEALSCGVHVVAYQTEANEEVLERYGGMALVPYGDSEALFRRTCELLASGDTDRSTASARVRAELSEFAAAEWYGQFI